MGGVREGNCIQCHLVDKVMGGKGNYVQCHLVDKVMGPRGKRNYVQCHLVGNMMGGIRETMYSAIWLIK